MVDKRFLDKSMIYNELSPAEQEKWFEFTKNKFLHNIDTFYYSVKFKQDFRLKTQDNNVLRLRSFSSGNMMLWAIMKKWEKLSLKR